MAKKFRRFGALVMALVMCASMLGTTAFAAEAPASTYPEVTVELIPGEDSDNSMTNGSAYGELTRKVTASTTNIETTTKQTESKLTAPQSALKFDRNSTADQKAQQKVRDLYTDNGHFTDPASITVAEGEAPEGYPFKYIGSGDYSGHYVSHVRVVFERDANGNAIKDANGNYVIKELQHSNGTPLTTDLQPTTSFDGPYDQTTGTRPLQFLLKDASGNTVYGYCIDLETGAATNNWYAIANLEDNDYYASKEAEDHVRGIVFNGYWGTADGQTGSLSSMKAALKAALAAGKIDTVYDVNFRNRVANKGQALTESQYASDSYVYTKLSQQVILTDEIIDQLTEGEALDAMQCAIWTYANGSRANLDGTDRMVVGDLYYASSAMGDSRNGVNDFEGAARTKALYTYLIQQTASAGSVIINDKTFAENMSLTIGNKLSDDTYEAALKFSMPAAPDQEKDNLNVVLTYVDANGETQTLTTALTGTDALDADTNGFYTISGLNLKAGVPFEFTLNIVGEQYLHKNAYIYTAELGTKSSQTMVGMAEGTITIDVSKKINASFDVVDTLVPPPDYTIEFNPGQASNISFMLLDPATGAVEFLNKIDIENQTSFEIPTEEGKVSAVFVKQAQSGMFWFAEEVSEDLQQAVIDCLKANNPSYKGHNAVAFGEGEHDLEFKKGKFATYTFTAGGEYIPVESKPETNTPEVPETPAAPETEEPALKAVAPEAAPAETTAPETTAPEASFHSETAKTHLLGDAEGDLATFNFKVVEEYIPAADDDKYTMVGAGEQTEFWTAYLLKDPAGELKVNGESYSYIDNAKQINGIYLDGKFYPADSDAITYPGKETGSKLVANYNGLQQGMLMNGDGKKVAVYCADHVTASTSEARYSVVNIEDATHYDAYTAGKIRAVAMNGYWGGTETVDQYGTLAKVKAMMAASGQFTREEIDHLSPGVALSATQFAIWELANDDDNRQVVNVQYIQKNRVAGYNGKSWNTLKVTPESEDACVDLIFKLSHYLTTLDPVSVVDPATTNTILNYKNILTDIAIEPLYKAEGHVNNADDNKDNDAYVTNVTFDMLQVSEKDNLVAKIVDANGEVYANANFDELIYNGNGTYTFPNVTLIENHEITYTVVVEGVQYLERNVYLYFAGEREISQTMIGYDEGEVSVDVESSVKETFNVDEPETPPTVSFNSGDASNISFMLIDRATGKVEFLKKIDIGNETSFEIPAEEGKISAVFVKQSTSGMFWTSEPVSEEVMDAVIACLAANNPSYKGFNAIAYGAGSHELEFKPGKFVTYQFEGMANGQLVYAGSAVEAVESTEPEATEPEVTEPEVTEPEVTEPEVTEPEVTEPEVTEPEVTEPEVTEPEVTEPEVTEPEVTEPEVTEPDVTEEEPEEESDNKGNNGNGKGNNKNKDKKNKK